MYVTSFLCFFETRQQQQQQQKLLEQDAGSCLESVMGYVFSLFVYNWNSKTEVILIQTRRLTVIENFESFSLKSQCNMHYIVLYKYEIENWNCV